MRLIDADTLANNITVLFEKNKALADKWLMYRVEDEITEAPTIEVEPTRHGEWKWVKVPKGADFSFYQCSICGEARWLREKYCANCGARMEGVEE